MPSATVLIARLDAGLAKAGEEITLRHAVLTNQTNQVNVDCPGILAAVREPTDEELIAGITQETLVCIFSPTQINQKQWPGGQPITATEDPRIPSKIRNDKAYVRGRWRAVQWGQGFYPTGELVRIEMRVLG